MQTLGETIEDAIGAVMDGYGSDDFLVVGVFRARREVDGDRLIEIVKTRFPVVEGCMFQVRAGGLRDRMTV